MHCDMIYILGASGRLGREIVAALDEQGMPYTSIRRDDLKSPESLKSILKKRGVLIDVSLPEGTQALSRALVNILDPMLNGVIVGVTGHSAEHVQSIYDMSKSVPTVLVSNFSKGVFLLEMMLSAQTKAGVTVAELAKRLGFDTGLFEVHHTQKMDAPSGTAKTLATVAQLPLEKIVSQRVGNVVGFHEISFSGEAEDIRLSHTAHSRKLFAVGAIDLAKRLASKTMPPGLFDMAAVLGEGAS